MKKTTPFSVVQESPDAEPATPITWVDMSKWDSEPVPERKWAIKDRVPLNQAGLFSGEGGTGKSIIELMKNVAHVTGKDWFGSTPEHGAAFYIGAEDEEDELHRRVAAIARHYGLTFKELVEGGLYIKCLLGEDATLCSATGKSGKVETTALYRSLIQAAGDIKPKNISIDTLSRAFVGNEIDRVQVYGFAMHMQALAMAANGSVTVLSHPSLAGLSSGSGLSGSTAWHGAFRFRQYLKGVKADKGDQPENDLRELEFKKNQYGPLGETIAVRLGATVFLCPNEAVHRWMLSPANKRLTRFFSRSWPACFTRVKTLAPTARPIITRPPSSQGSKRRKTPKFASVISRLPSTAF